MERIIEANDAAGHHFFEAGAMRFFNSTLYPRVYGGRYFITGERIDFDHPVRFTIRVALDNGHVNTVGDFQAFASYEEAEDAVIEGLCGSELAGEGS
jgi:hypothetical protein